MSREGGDDKVSVVLALGELHLSPHDEAVIDRVVRRATGQTLREWFAKGGPHFSPHKRTDRH